MAPKISDVAREAGVSPATVSRVLNDLATVDPELQLRVRNAALKLGYRPNAVARSLRTQASSVWALIISDIENPFFTAVARGVEDIAQRSGYSVLLCNTDEDPAKEDRYIQVALQQQAAGIIISPHSSQTSVSPLEISHIPVVAIDRASSSETDTVLVDSRAGARAGSLHLVQQGWQRIACITGPDDAFTAVERANGYRAALAESGIRDTIIAHVPFRSGAGQQALSELLDSGNPPDALFVANSALALGALAELTRRGLTMGQDIGLVAFDDAPWAPFIDPPITVVAQPANDIGQRAATMLLDRIGSGQSLEPRHLVLDAELIVRESSLRAR